MISPHYTREDVPEQQLIVESTLEALQELGGSGTNDQIRAYVVRKFNIPEGIARVTFGGSSQTNVLEYRLRDARTRLGKRGLIVNQSKGRWALKGINGDEENLQPKAFLNRTRLSDQSSDQTAEHNRTEGLYAQAPNIVTQVENSKVGRERTRWAITHEFARWAAHSALRNPGSPIRSRKDVYGALDKVDFEPLLNKSLGPIGIDEFNGWHRDSVLTLVDIDQRLNYGWASKIINIYLKTCCYLAGFGREGLERVIHPPIDNILIADLRKRFRLHHEIYCGLASFSTISSLTAVDYKRLIDCFNGISQIDRCLLFEVEQYFQPS